MVSSMRSLSCVKIVVATFGIASLTACGGGGNTSPPPTNSAPVANAGQIQNILVASNVILDGSKSNDANNDALTYSWILSSKPAGSAAVLVKENNAMPTFIADVAGTYTASLVVNDGKVNSAPSTVTITATSANAAPVANAGVNQNVATGTLVVLDGSTSSDANGDPITYYWTLTSKPTGSNAELLSKITANPTFNADLTGTYVASLVVNDGKVDSNTATIIVTSAVVNVAPVANAGLGQRALVGSTITLNGSSSSDGNNDKLTYLWGLTSKPTGSNASLSLKNSIKPYFTADKEGEYVVSLIVNDGVLSSTSATNVVKIVPRITGALGIYTGLTTSNFCNFGGSGYIGGPSSYWTFTNCKVYGAAGSPLVAVIQNNGSTPLIITSIDLSFSSFSDQFVIGAASQTIEPGEKKEFKLPLWVGAEVTNAIAKFAVNGEPDFLVYFSGDMTLP